MSIVIFSIVVLALVAFFFYKMKGLFASGKSLPKENVQPQKAIQLAKKEDKFMPHRTTKLKLDTLKNDYGKLSDFLIHGCPKERMDELFSNIEEVKSKDIKPNDQGFYYLTKLMDQQVKPEYFHFFNLDWKAGIEELYQHIQKRLVFNDIKAELPKVSDYPENVTVSYTHVLKDYNFALNKVGLGLWFVRNPTDTYTLFIYRLDQADQTFWALSHVGLNIDPYKPEWDA